MLVGCEYANPALQRRSQVETACPVAAWDLQVKLQELGSALFILTASIFLGCSHLSPPPQQDCIKQRHILWSVNLFPA